MKAQLIPYSSNKKDYFSLSFEQERMWFLEQLEPGNPAYNIRGAIQIKGRLNADILEQSINEIIRRHEILRTTFNIIDGQPRQIIGSPFKVELPVVDLQKLSTTEREQEARRLVTQIFQQPFDVSKSPLWRVSLLLLEETQHILVLSMHQIVCDGDLSIGIFFREIGVLFQAFSTNQPSPLSQLPIQYKEFTLWQREHLKEELLEAQLAYWKQQLGDNLPILQLPIDRPRPPIQTYPSAYQYLNLSEELTSQLKLLSQQQGVTLFVTLLATFKTLLYRYTSQEDIIVGSPVSVRNLPETDRLIGCFGNRLALRTDVSGNPTFLELLSRVALVVNQAENHQDYPFSKLVEQLKPQRDMSFPPLFQVLFTLRDDLMPTVELPSFTLTPLDVEGTFVPYDLCISIKDTDSKLIWTWEYNTDLFESDTITRLLKHFQNLLESIVANPEGRIGELSILTEAERHQLLVEWNNTKIEYPQVCIHKLVEDQIEQSPDAVAVVLENEQLTYRDLNCRANQLAHYLQKLGVKPEGLVGICTERSLLMMIAILAVLKAGSAYVPLDPTYPKERLEYMLSDANVQVLLTTKTLLLASSQIAEIAKNQEVVCLDSEWEIISQQSDSNPVSQVQPHNLAYVIYTSGSTGKPKGVMMEHLALSNLIDWHFQNRTKGARTLQFASFSFDISFHEIFSTWCSLGTLVLISEDVRRNPEALLNFILEKKIEKIYLPFVALQQWAEVIDDRTVPTSLREIMTAGEQLQITPAIANFFRKTGCTLYNHYGATECQDVTSFTLTGDANSWPTLPSIGRPINNIQTYILDEFYQPVPIGVPGELYIGGDGIARGYFNRSDLTQEKFIPNPFGAGRLYKTGDLARILRDGNIEHLGRIDHQVKIRGFRIELGEIEENLSKHPSVKQAAITAREDVPGDKRLVAYLVLHSSPESESNFIRELRQFLQQRLPDYMIPSHFVVLESLPLNPNGKVNRRALPKPEINPAELSTFVAPRTTIEEILAGIWAEILRVERVGVNDNFFELGGHSLLATQIIARIRDRLKVDLPFSRILEFPTVAGLALIVEEVLQQEQRPIGIALQPISRNQRIPLSFSQEQLWFLAQVEPNIPVYNEPCTIRFPGAIDVDALEKALNAIINRHESLRTHFMAVDGQPVMVIEPFSTLNLTAINLKHLPEQEREAEALRLAKIEAIKPFDLSSDLLLRAILMQLSDKDYRLFLTFHHIIIDAVSLYNIFLKELAALYKAFSTSQPLTLAELPVQYADFAVWQRQLFTEEILESRLNYWKQQLADLPVLELPLDRSRPPIQTFRGARQGFALSKDLTAALKSLSRKEGVTLYTTLLAAFKTLLNRYSGQEDIVVGTVSAGRNQPEIEGLIGFFVNTLVLRTNVSGNPSFQELLFRVREVTLAAYAYEDLPFEKLVEILQPERNLTQNPLFQVAFTAQPSMPSLSEGWTLSYPDINTDTAKFDLTLDVEERLEEIIAWFEYNADLFEASAIARMIGHFQTLLSGIVANPKQQISELPLLTEAERYKLLIEWNNTTKDYCQDKCIHQLFEEQVERSPDAVAVVFEEEQLTYRELNAKANQLAHYLRSLGVGTEVLVGICVERSIEMLIGLLGILKAGGAYVPLDPAYPTERIIYVLQNAGALVLVTQKSLLENLPESWARLVCLDANWNEIAQQRKDNPNSSVKPDHLAYVIYTSGSTGQPKGVQIPHSAVVNFLVSMSGNPGLAASDILLAVTTVSFDIAALEIFLPLTVGAISVLVSREVTSDGRQLSAILDQAGATVMQATPATWRMLLESGWIGNSNLKILCGGDALPRELANQLLSRCASLWNMYGPTETTVWSAVSQVTEGEEPPRIGRAIANSQFYICDSHLQPIPVGVWGELHIGGVGLARGYLNRPDLTEAKFIPNPFSNQPSERLYKTGDLVRYLPDGNIEFLGRIDNQVKIRGFRIELGEIEASLLEHPKIQEAVVIVREEADIDQRLVAYIVPSNTNDDYLPSAQVELWQQVFNDAYQQPQNTENDPTLNLASWNDSYTRKPYSQAVMQEWRDKIVDQIMELKPKRVWEIGCGTGMLLLKIAPHCQKYLGTDIAAAGLHYIEQHLQQQSLKEKVTLKQSAANQFDPGEADAYDLVILNSVSQYFPSLDYLFSVLEGAVRSVMHNGSIFIGDVRNLKLLEAFHTAVEFYRATDELLIKDLRQQIQKSIRTESELLIDPDFFIALKQRFPRISQVQIQWKRGYAQTEMSRFRYDVVLHLDQTDISVGEPEWFDWQTQHLSLEMISKILTTQEPDLLGIKAIPNHRLTSEMTLLETIGQLDATVTELKELITQEAKSGIDPEAFRTLLPGLPYTPFILYNSTRYADYDVVFQRNVTGQVTIPRFAIAPNLRMKPWQHYVNQPLQYHTNKVDPELLGEWRDFLAEKLPDYMIPSHFTVLERLPLTPNGKVDRRALPAPDNFHNEQEDQFVGLGTPTEAKMAAIWAEVLGLKRVGINDNFFELGGHSLLATQIISRMGQAFAIEVPLRHLFEAPTIASLGKMIEPGLHLASQEQSEDSEVSESLPALTPVPRETHIPLSKAQEYIWYVQQLNPHRCGCNSGVALRFSLKLSSEILEKSINEIIRRHEIMRTTFPVVEGQPVQAIAPELTLPLKIVDLQNIPLAKRKNEAIHFSQREMNYHFDLANGPLIKTTLVQLSSEEHWLLMPMHHIITDGWSVGLFVEELETLYTAFSKSLPSPLAEMPLQYADFTLWQRQRFNEEVLARQLNYWLQKLAAPLQTQEYLPEREPKPNPNSGRASSYSLVLRGNIVASLEDLSRSHSVTISTIIIAALKLLLFKYHGQSEIMIVATIGNRSTPEIEKMLGCFINDVILRSQIDDEQTGVDLLEQVKETLNEAIANKEIPLQQVIEAVKSQRKLTLSASVTIVPPVEGSDGRFVSEIALGSDKDQLWDEEIPLELYISSSSEESKSMEIYVFYSTDLFGSETIERMFNYYQKILQKLAESPEMKIAEFEGFQEKNREAAK